MRIYKQEKVLLGLRKFETPGEPEYVQSGVDEP